MKSARKTASCKVVFFLSFFGVEDVLIEGMMKMGWLVQVVHYLLVVSNPVKIFSNNKNLKAS